MWENTINALERWNWQLQSLVFMALRLARWEFLSITEKSFNLEEMQFILSFVIVLSFPRILA